jgi:hypothetical protein
VGLREIFEGAGISVVNVVVIEAAELWKHGAAYVGTDTSTVGDLRVSEASITSLASLISPFQTELINIRLGKGLLVDDHDLVRGIEGAATIHQINLLLQLLLLVHTLHHVGAVPSHLVIEAD